jgi:hypothetical protein
VVVADWAAAAAVEVEVGAMAAVVGTEVEVVAEAPAERPLLHAPT